MIPKSVQRKIDAKVIDSTEWLGYHMAPKYTDAAYSEKAFLGGMAFVIAAINGTTQEEEYQKMLANVPIPAEKKKVRRRPSAAPKKKIVVRRKR